MIEWPGNHETLTGGHVLYMDGHVEWHDFPGEFPMTENVINALDAIANWNPATAWSVPRFIGPQDQYNNGLCKGAVRGFSLATKMYANLAEGEFYPPLSSEAGLLMTEDERFFRFYFGDLRRLNCPGSTMAYRQPEIHDDSYVYLGYVIPDQETLERFATGYQQQIAAGGDFTGNLLEGEDAVHRMREGVERFLITDINSPVNPAYAQFNLPVLIEWPDNHVGVRGGNVLFMDGDVEWIDYPGKFPMTEEAMGVLTQLAGRGPIREVEPSAEGPTRLERLLNLVGITSRR
jgi:prepilin-type processing-associated H-X9-DG protein